MIRAFLEALNAATTGRRVLVVAAADLAHLGPAFGGDEVDATRRERLRDADDELIERMCAGDWSGFFNAVRRVEDCNNVCGLSPIYLALRMLGGAKGEKISYDLCPADDNDTSFVSVCGVVLR
jgi:AmmeMemoRadiSam system protein B